MRYLILLFSVTASSLFAQMPSRALQNLIDGNLRYAEDRTLHADHSSDRRNSLVEGQAPLATIVSCSDSRVPPEIIFDQGTGNLFVVRVAGNVVGPIELDSIDYSVKVLGVKLVLVMGHESCGAVKAVMEKNTKDIEAVASLIQPAIKKGSDLEATIKNNVRHVVASLSKSPFLKQLIEKKQLECVGGYYKIATGTVEILK